MVYCFVFDIIFDSKLSVISIYVYVDEFFFLKKIIKFLGI